MASVVPERRSRGKGPAHDAGTIDRCRRPPDPTRRRGRGDLVALLVLAGFVALRLLLGGGAGEWVVIGVVAALLFLRPRS